MRTRFVGRATTRSTEIPGQVRRKTPHTRARAKGAEAPEPGRTLTDEAYTNLEELIATLELPPGSAVSEAMLSKRLGIGRTPIREALQRLRHERLVTILPRRGVMISDIDVNNQLRLLEVRREVERLVARCAARRATREQRAKFGDLADRFEASARRNDSITFMRVDRAFNELCLEAARNEFATSAMGLMQSLSRRFWYHHYKQAANLPETAKLHAAIARGICGGDEERAAKALDRLLDNIERFTRATVSPDI